MSHSKRVVKLIKLAFVAVFLMYPLIGRYTNIFIYANSANDIKTPEENQKLTTIETKLPEKLYELRRLDFRIKGASCPTCLLSIQKELKSLAGVEDAVVLLKHPFTASVIYQSEETNTDYILAMTKIKVPSIKIVDVNDNRIEDIPNPLIPPEKSNYANASTD